MFIKIYLKNKKINYPLAICAKGDVVVDDHVFV